MWVAFAFGSAFFAGVTSILAKCGIRKTDSTIATAIRTIVVLIFSWLMVFVVGSQGQIGAIGGRTLLFLVLSGLATGASWLCYFKALQLGADEYLTNPCRKDRLLARVSNILKRYEGRSNLIDGPDFLLDRQTYTLYIHSTSVVLPKNQGKLLAALLSGGDAPVTTEQLCLALWGTAEYIDENAPVAADHASG